MCVCTLSYSKHTIQITQVHNLPSRSSADTTNSNPEIKRTIPKKPLKINMLKEIKGNKGNISHRRKNQANNCNNQIKLVEIKIGSLNLKTKLIQN